MEGGKAKLESKDANGATPMGVAASCGDQTVTLYLLSKGADPEVQLLPRCPQSQAYIPVLHACCLSTGPLLSCSTLLLYADSMRDATIMLHQKHCETQTLLLTMQGGSLH